MILTWESRSNKKISRSSTTFPSEDSIPTGFKSNLGLNSEKQSEITKLINFVGRKENYVLIAIQICKFKI